MRRKTIACASAAALGSLCLGAALTGCGAGHREGYVAADAAGPGSSRAPYGAVPPKGGVVLVPLDAGGDRPSSRAPQPTTALKPPAPRQTAGRDHGPTASPGVTTAPRPGPAPATSGSRLPAQGSSSGAPPRPPSSAPAPTAPTTPQGTPGPAILSVFGPRRAPADQRWCERVALTFANTGGTPVTGGTVRLGTHVIGVLGTDWATVPTAFPLPAPIAAGQAVEEEWTVCVEEWRVLPGMHIETRDASVELPPGTHG